MHSIEQRQDWAMPCKNVPAGTCRRLDPGAWRDLAAAVAEQKGVAAPGGLVQADDAGTGHRQVLLGGERKAVLAGQRCCAPCPGRAPLLALAQWIG